MTLTVTFNTSTEKKHSIRYDAQYKDQTPAVSTIYVSKEALPKPYPKAIKVTIEEA